MFRKYYNRKRVLGLHSSDDYTEFTDNDIFDINIQCEECTRLLWNNTEKKNQLL